MKNKKEKTYTLTKIIKSKYSMSFKKKFKSEEDAITYAKEKNYTIINDLGKTIYKNEN